MKKIASGLFGVGLMSVGAPAFAEDCSAISCPTGQTVVSFGDGNSAQCMCVEQGSGMVATEEMADGCIDSDDDGACD